MKTSTVIKSALHAALFTLTLSAATTTAFAHGDATHGKSKAAVLTSTEEHALTKQSDPKKMIHAPVIEVYKSATCGCCNAWIDHLKANGFAVNAHNVANPSDYRKKLGISDEMGSCHTGIVQGYVIEGHVPAAEIKRLLAERPMAKGLAVPAMPMGSPGMEGHRSDSYDVLLVGSTGRTSIYKHYNGN